MIHFILVLNMNLVLVAPARGLPARDEAALVALPTTTAQERDLQSVRPGGHVEWGEADAPKDESVHVGWRPEVLHVRWHTGVLGDHT